MSGRFIRGICARFRGSRVRQLGFCAGLSQDARTAGRARARPALSAGAARCAARKRLRLIAPCRRSKSRGWIRPLQARGAQERHAQSELRRAQSRSRHGRWRSRRVLLRPRPRWRHRANVDRWVKQFTDVPAGDVKRADREANGLHQHTVEITHGTFDAGMAVAPGRSQERLRARRRYRRSAERRIFSKLTGPAKTVAAARPRS